MPLHISHSFFRKKELLTADTISKQVAFLGKSTLLPIVMIKESDPYVSDACEIIVQKDNLRTSIEVPLFAMAMSLDDFSKRYLKPVADKLYAEAETRLC